ncbi:NAD(P)/FAD-dependent oxidoreductase [Alkalinema sp. FACHB-956]|uniref:NAD(P)/FAD-dependent oxidoreductase n=1 Tax=Alkalinema sp. FACHB-956 TaxID=2692768 RepID=UPI0016857960|nr:NAD(P)/FAD-dependent oxidoreductase [Alkalinema sp. FACHB-956]MBD2328666.1 NAD(P)/FAD-dependent oxidoreductase [Alkalinema sp. FACHB-956]
MQPTSKATSQAISQANDPSADHPTIVVGGGFVGLFTALHLSHQNYSHPILLIEQNDRFSFKPLLYELLSHELHSEQVYPRYQDLLAGSRVKFVQDTVTTIDLHQKQITVASGQQYDYGNLVLALGSKTTYFHTPGADRHTFPLTNGAEAIALRRHLRTRLHEALQLKTCAERRALLTVAIVGAGPAGIELACTLADLLPIWYDELGGDSHEIRIVLVNRSRELLKGDINSQLRCTVQRALKQRQVEFLFDAAVSEIQSDRLHYQQHKQDHTLNAGTIVWTAGTSPNSLLMTLPIAAENRDPRGRLIVTPMLQLPEFPEVFAAGDCAITPSNPQPPTAQVAYQQGQAIAQNLKLQTEGKALLPVQVYLRGTLMKLGLNEGVANLFNKVQIKGQPGHLMRQATYLRLLPTPAHNARITTEWLTDELLQRHRPFTPMQLGQTPFLQGMAAIAASLILASPLAWRAAQPQQFQQSLHWSGIPTLLDQWVTAKR